MQNDTQTIAQTDRATEEMETLNFRLPVSLRRRFRIAAAELDLTTQQAGNRAIDMFVSQHEETKVGGK